MKGKVKWFSGKKGYGFITPKAGGNDVFVHFSAIESEGYKTLEEGDEVEFETQKTDRGMSAVKVRKVE
ncbi:MAG: cold-shock protein [Candidatus Omnitrophota bacterium]|jgi:CspA family cold shock protein